MAEPRLISPMLDGFMMSNPISEHHGVCCCPAIKEETDERYIVKVISIPATPSQMEALILSGAYKDEASALDYYKELADTVLKEVEVLKDLSEMEGFIPYADCQIVPMESGKGYEIYLLGSYKRSLSKHFKRHIFTHLDALNLGLDLCAALSVCRRHGHMYVDLKPGNIFVTDQRLFRIGDLGFVRLDALKYASLPDKYFSVYTPPEVRDAFSDLNSTMDVYAAGLILYQTYNNGELPFNSEIQPGDKLPAPLYADYEMSEIILKACNPNLDERWQDPMQMGQAIVSYMQRNGAMDVPIIPMPAQDTQEDNTAVENIAPEQDAETVAEDTATEPDIAAESGVEDTDPSDATETEEAAEPEEIDESPVEELNEFSILEEDTDDDIASDEIDENYDNISTDVSEMLNQADELAALDVPEPVVVPEHVEVTMPEPPVIEEKPEAEEAEESTEATEACEEEQTEEFDEESEDFDDLQEDSQFDFPEKNHHWLRNTVIAVIVLALLAGGFLFYKNFYLLPIEITAVEGNKDTLTVLVTTDIDESLLQVVCSDTYGNKIPSPVINGKAEFSGLVPNTAYSIKVVAKGFHRLTGSPTAAYSTPIQTNIVQFDAIAGNTEDSAILSFTVEGPSDEWTIYYTAEGEEERTAVFTDAHMITLTNLTLGKEYTFRLASKQPLYITGQSEIKFTPRKLIRAKQLTATSCLNNKLTVVWSAPDGENVHSWTVRCYNDNYNQTTITTDTSATFEGLDHTAEFNIEVKAYGMSVGEKIVVPAKSITASNFNINTSDPTKLTFSWDPSQPIPADGWVLRYSIAGIGNETTIPCNQNSVEIISLIPNSTYRIQLEDTNGSVLLGSQKEILTGSAVDFQKEFESFNVSRDDLTFAMCRTPKRPNWGRYDLADSDYTTAFAVGEAASFLVRAKKSCYDSSENVTTMYVILDQSGAPILTAQDTRVWSDMWKSYNCKLEIPVMPTEAGNYTIEVYFDGGLAHSQAFTIQ